jgi:hypothetical protein
LAADGRAISISHGNATAVRWLTKSDRLGWSLSEARASQAGQPDLWYKHHWEANLVLEGALEVTEAATGEMHPIGSGGLYNAHL